MPLVILFWYLYYVTFEFSSIKVYISQHWRPYHDIYRRSVHTGSWNGGRRRAKAPHPLPPRHRKGQLQVHEEGHEGII